MTIRTVLPSPGALETPAACRQHRRFTLDALVSLSSDDCFVMGDAQNISEGGIYIATLSPPAQGELIDLRIRTDDETCPPLDLQGRIAWIRMDEDGEAVGCGVAFLDLNAVSQAGLRAMIDRLDRRPLMWDL